MFNPETRPLGITFMNDAIRDEEQFAAFGEFTFHATDQLSVTLGARYYDIETSLVGSSNFATLCGGPCGPEADEDGGRSYDVIFADVLPLKEDDTILKVSASYTPNDDLLFFATWSEGFRPGGFNRNADVPLTYVSDEVTNMEFGWKTTLADGTVRFNGSIYAIDWDNMQVGVTDFENFGVLTFVLNAADADIRIEEATQTADGLFVRIDGRTATLPVFGEVNAHNATAAVAMSPRKLKPPRKSRMSCSLAVGDSRCRCRAGLASRSSASSCC